MEKRDLIITVSGQAMTGKSIISYLLKKFLRENGFDVEFGGDVDFNNERSFDEKMSIDYLQDNYTQLKDKIKITLKQEQSVRK